MQYESNFVKTSLLLLVEYCRIISKIQYLFTYNSAAILAFLRHLFGRLKAIRGRNSLRDRRTNLKVNFKNGPRRPIEEAFSQKLPKFL